MRTLKVKQKSRLNRPILRQGWGELGRQLGYKQSWAGGLVEYQSEAYTCGFAQHDHGVVLTYPLVRCRGQLVCRSGTISVAKGVNFRDHATDR